MQQFRWKNLFSNLLIKSLRKAFYNKWLILGLAIWAMHFIGMLASHLPEGYHFDISLTVLVLFVGAVASIFAVWLTTRPTLPLPRLVLGAILWA
jgi:NO-binding membrane sensor protein with MHYT domain